MSKTLNLKDEEVRLEVPELNVSEKINRVDRRELAIVCSEAKKQAKSLSAYSKWVTKQIHDDLYENR